MTCSNAYQTDTIATYAQFAFAEEQCARDQEVLTEEVLDERVPRCNGSGLSQIICEMERNRQRENFRKDVQSFCKAMEVYIAEHQTFLSAVFTNYVDKKTHFVASSCATGNSDITCPACPNNAQHCSQRKCQFADGVLPYTYGSPSTTTFNLEISCKCANSFSASEVTMKKLESNLIEFTWPSFFSCPYTVAFGSGAMESAATQMPGSTNECGGFPAYAPEASVSYYGFPSSFFSLIFVFIIGF